MFIKDPSSKKPRQNRLRGSRTVTQNRLCHEFPPVEQEEETDGHGDVFDRSNGLDRQKGCAGFCRRKFHESVTTAQHRTRNYMQDSTHARRIQLMGDSTAWKGKGTLNTAIKGAHHSSLVFRTHASNTPSHATVRGKPNATVTH